MVRVEVPVDASWGRANARAARLAGMGLRPRRLSGEPGRGRYSVPSGSRAGGTYTVQIIAPERLQALCSCPHGREGHTGHCWHTAACLGAELALLSKAQDDAEAAWGAQRASEAQAAKMARFARA